MVATLELDTEKMPPYFDDNYETVDGHSDFLRSRYYNAANGRFNRPDPFQGDPFAPQSLHKYAYAHNNPVNRTDPTGTFSVINMATNMAITSVLTSILSPVIKPAASYLAKALIPNELLQSILTASLPSAIMLGASAAGGGGYGPATVTTGGGLEYLYSPWTRKAGVYGYWESLRLGFGGSGGWRGAGEVAVKAGLVFHCRTAGEYAENFVSYTVPLNALSESFIAKIGQLAAAVTVSGLTQSLANPRFSPTAMQHINQLRRHSGQISRIFSKLRNLPRSSSLTIFHDLRKTTVGFSLNAAVGYNMGSVSFAHQYYWLLSNNGADSFV